MRAARELFHQFGDQQRVAVRLERLAGVQSAQGRLLDAARLFGAAEGCAWTVEEILKT